MSKSLKETGGFGPDGKQQTEAEPVRLAVCANCSTRLQGPICHECGQKADSPLRHLGALLDDVADSFFNFDSRIIRTLPTLFFCPGSLTRQYFAGHRVRYLAPFRSMFLLSVLAFLVIQINIGTLPLAIDFDANGIANATSVTQVENQVAAGLVGLERARRTAGDSVAPKLAEAEQELRRQGEQRIAELSKSSTVAPPEKTVPRDEPDPIPQDSKSDFYLTGHPALVNSGMKEKIELLIKSGPARQRFLGAVFNALPPAMVVLLPLFALLLKLAYIFRRRLYVEHLIVALHSHAFIFLALLLLGLLNLLDHWLVPHAGWVHSPLNWLKVVAAIWIPLYLLLMQKRVYQQGWLVTGFKYLFVGFCYTILLSFTLVGALLITLQRF